MKKKRKERLGHINFDLKWLIAALKGKEMPYFDYTAFRRDVKKLCEDKTLPLQVRATLRFLSKSPKPKYYVNNISKQYYNCEEGVYKNSFTYGVKCKVSTSEGFLSYIKKKKEQLINAQKEISSRCNNLEVKVMGVDDVPSGLGFLGMTYNIANDFCNKKAAREYEYKDYPFLWV